MIQQLAVYESTSFDPHFNLAVEQHLLETVGKGQCVLYLWRNENTVVIGRNQNPWKECRTTLLQQEGGHLARRLSGGGAVFHDLGNLNFTFLMPQEEYDLDRQLAVIQSAVGSFGIPVERSGRNDILAEGRKFSGSAFYRNGSQAYHHGTLLVAADMEKLNRYLTPAKAKLQAKGVASVRSRVVNLQELAPQITVEKLQTALCQAFSDVYGLPYARMESKQLDTGAVETLTERNRSWEWNFGQKLPFSVSCEGRFGWGGIQLSFAVESGVVTQCRVFSDAMDWQLAPKLEQGLVGCRFSAGALEERIEMLGLNAGSDIIALLPQIGL